MSHPSRTPSWDEIEQFCENDGWEPDRKTDHLHWRKTLPSGEVLETHRSKAGRKTMSQNVFGVILRTQLKVSRAQFWEVIGSGQPAERPGHEELPEPTYEPWVVLRLKDTGMTEEEIRSYSPDEARDLLHEKWSEPRTD